MAILIDLNQVMLSGLTAQLSSNKIKKLEEDLVRHMVLNSLRASIKKFKPEYGEVILCCDNKEYWRKSYFPNYKANRKKSRDKSDLDWNLIFKVLNELKEDLKENFPYKVIDVSKAEADDIIGTLTPRLSTNEKVLIVSSDGDFKQLHRYKNVKQYNPMLSVYVKSANPILELKEKIIRGDSGDGIPNILSSDSVFISNTRQKSIMKTFLEEMLNTSPDNILDENLKRNWIRNETLIDLTKTPIEVQRSIVEAYDTSPKGTKQKLFKYLVSKGLVALIECIEDF